MNPYQYAEYRNPWAPSIAQVLLHGGDIEAQRAATVAGAQARATEIGGQAKAAAVAGIGNSVAGVVDAATNPQRQLAAAQLDAVKRDNRSRLIFETELKNPANLKPDGSIDDQAITARLKAQDVGAWQSWSAISAANQKNALDLRAKGAEIAKTNADTAEKTRQFQQAQADYLGRLGYHALETLKAKPDDPLHARDTVLASTARAIVDGGISESEGKQFLMQTAHASPDQLQSLFASVVPPELKAKLEKESADTAKANAEAEEAKAKAKVLADYGTTTPPTSQTIKARVKGVGDVPLEVVPGKAGQASSYFLATPQGRRQLYPGSDFTEIPPATIQINQQNALTDDALDMAAKQYASTGVMPMGARDRDTQRRIMNRAAQLFPALDPALNKAEYTANADSLKALQKQRDAVGAFESTATKNIDLFLQTAGKVVDTGSPLANTLVRQASGRVLGSPDQAAYDAARQVAVNEIAKITSNPTLAGQLSDNARHEVEAFNPQNATLKQTVAVMRLLKQDMANRVGSLDEQIGNIKTRLGAPKPATPPAGPGAAGVTVTSPSGKSYPFKTQAEADAFVAAAKAQGLWK